MTNAFKLLLLAVGIFGVATPMQATAQSLGTCSGTCSCTGTEIDDYGNCTIITESGMVDTMDPADVASKTGLTASYTTGGEVHVSVDIDEPSGVVIPVNDYNGNWPDLDTLQGYLEELYDGNLPTAALPDYCTKFFAYDLYKQDGAIARWNPSTGDWASFQVQDVVLAAIASDNGKVLVDGVEVLSPPVLIEGCLVDSDGALSGETCSRVLAGAIQETNACKEDNGTGGSVAASITTAVAEERNIEWSGFETEVQYSGSLAGGDLKFEIKRATAETVEATGLWYDAGSYDGQDFNDATDDDYAGVRETGPDGVCTSIGYAARDENVLGSTVPREVFGETREGTAPVSCPQE